MVASFPSTVYHFRAFPHTTTPMTPAAIPFTSSNVITVSTKVRHKFNKNKTHRPSNRIFRLHLTPSTQQWQAHGASSLPFFHPSVCLYNAIPNSSATTSKTLFSFFYYSPHHIRIPTTTTNMSSSNSSPEHSPDTSVDDAAYMITQLVTR